MCRVHGECFQCVWYRDRLSESWEREENQVTVRAQAFTIKEPGAKKKISWLCNFSYLKTK